MVCHSYLCADGNSKERTLEAEKAVGGASPEEEGHYRRFPARPSGSGSDRKESSGEERIGATSFPLDFREHKDGCNPLLCQTERRGERGERRLR